MIGLGAKDTLADAHEFVESFGPTTPAMVWDGTFESWEALGIAGQPATVLFDERGRRLDTWYGLFDPEAVTAALEGA